MRDGLISVSELRARNTCKRLHWYRYLWDKDEPGEMATPLIEGTAIHAALEIYWLSKGGEYERALNTLADPRLRGMFAAYHRRWADTMAGFKILGVESYFKTDLTHGYFDGLARDADGALIVVEHKTTAFASSAYEELLAIDPQVSLYWDAARRLYNEEPAYILYDVLEKPSIRPRKDEEPDEFEARCVDATSLYRWKIYRDIEDVQQCRAEIAEEIRQLSLVSRAVPEPRNTAACRIGNRLCGYFPVCKGEASIESLPDRERRR